MRQVDGEEFLEVVARDMERSPEQYKEYIEEISQVDPDYPTHGGYMIVNHQNMVQMGGEKPCFHNIDEAVSWAEYHLDHNNYNIYQIKVAL
jgi:hypothetical protein